MPQYKLRTPLFRAISVDEILADINTCPQWVRNQHAAGNIVMQLGATVSVVTPKGKVIAGAADTLIQDALKRLSVMPTADFNALYETE